MWGYGEARDADEMEEEKDELEKKKTEVEEEVGTW